MAGFPLDCSYMPKEALIDAAFYDSLLHSFIANTCASQLILEHALQISQVSLVSSSSLKSIADHAVLSFMSRRSPPYPPFTGDLSNVPSHAIYLLSDTISHVYLCNINARELVPPFQAK